MSSGMAGANEERPAGTRRNGRSEVGPAAGRASSPTCSDTKGTRGHGRHRSGAAATPGTEATLSICRLAPAWQRWRCREAADAECDLLFLCPPERVAVWEAVAAYVREQLLVQKGVWIPTFGTFDTVPKDVRTEEGTVTLQWPVFNLASNLTATHHLKPHKESLPVLRKVEPMKYSKAAAAASLNWETLRTGIQSTMSLVAGCLQNGENVAIVLKDVGVLHIDGLTFEMKYFFDFLEKLSGKKKFRRAAHRAPWLLDVVVSRAAPVASLALSGCVVVFPMFQMEFVPKPPPAIHRKSSGSLSSWGTPKKEGTLPPLDQGKKVRFTGRPSFIRRLSSDSIDGGEFRRIRSLLRKESSRFSLLPAIRTVPEAQEQPVTCQLQGEAGTSSQQDLPRAPGTKRVSFLVEQQGAEKDQHEGAAQTLQAAKATPHHMSLRPRPTSRRGSESSSRAHSAQPQGRPSRLLRARDSVRLLRKRARKIMRVQKELKQMTPSPLRGESSLPEESGIKRPGLLPPIKEETGSPEVGQEYGCVETAFICP
ncbi:uncharacterized protein LOC125702760 [Lagopus muta]|uniref:uncharacterized protein LOC125702760 n=1 Tax=Lagopus muta TaxID=64668 RepID=UPI00209D2D24|nr:uncharacterized protein LOC125702760 [Lagopus muta]